MSSSQKENKHPGSLYPVKPEPVEYTLPKYSQDTRVPSKREEPSYSQHVKGDPFLQDAAAASNLHRPLEQIAPQSLPRGEMVQSNLPFLREPEPVYTQYKSADEIEYTPENALQEGVAMVKELSGYLKRIDIGSKLRKDVWIQDIETLLKQKSPRTMIAVCGATGAGKSSLLNAVLDDNIVPTSGMRACTAVITEISYQKKKTIDADVSFLSMEEWKDELSILLEDMVEEDGTLRRYNDMRSDAGIAWHKVHAVYPLLKPQQLVEMSAEDIIRSSPETARILGTVKKICAPTSKKFALEISKYVDSKDKKRGDKEKKDKAQREKEKRKEAEPALWPLIRLVQVHCPSEALSKGAVLVDLPGVADANAARSAIAKEYMKKCECIWIAAPITRAVDDKTAKDLLGDAFKTQLLNGNYDDSCITFIATKTDDISCSETIQSLGISDDPALMELDDKKDDLTEQLADLKKEYMSALRKVKALEKEKKPVTEVWSDLKKHLKALREGEEYISPLLKKGKGKGKGKNAKKRKASGGQGSRSAKRQKSSPVSDDEAMSEDGQDDESDAPSEMSDEIESDSESNSGSGDESDGERAYRDESDNESNASDREGGDDDAMDEDQEEVEEAVTEESLKKRIKELDDQLKPLREEIKGFVELKKERKGQVDKLKREVQLLQKQKNAFCALKRNEYTCEILKEDFRSGLREIDEETAEKENPDTFDPTEPLRDYASISMPVFTCSSRDYIRITKQVKGDGDPNCFSTKEDTGIPPLQQWCHDITVSARERVAKKFLHHLSTFLQQVSSYVSDMEGVSIQDRVTLRNRWETKENRPDAELNGAQLFRLPDFPSDDSDDEEPFDPYEYLMNNGKRARDRRKKGTGNGISERLQRALLDVTDKNVEELKKKFRTDLEDKCQTGARKAETAALETSDSFAASMHWQTYRATLRRLGEFRRDLNLELVTPLTKEIASSWARVFESDLFGPMNKAINTNVQKLIKEVEETSPPGLKDRCKTQGQLSLQDAEVAMRQLITKVKEQMSKEQKEISRCVAPHVRNELLEGYEEAMLERGTGSVARQKAKFHRYVESIKSTVFSNLSNHIIERLDSAVDAIQTVMDEALDSLANKVEVSISVLWEIPKDSEEQHRLRRELVKKIGVLNGLVQMWMDADELRGEEFGDNDDE